MLRRVAAPELRQMRCFGGDVRTERRAASGTRFDALSSNNLNASESDYTAKKNPNPRSYDGWSQACLFDCLHANEAYARCEACSPIFALYDRRCAFGGLNIRAHQPHTINDRGKPRFFRKTGDQECSEGANPTLCLPECRTGLTSACATYSSISVKELPDVLVKATLATGASPLL